MSRTLLFSLPLLACSSTEPIASGPIDAAAPDATVERTETATDASIADAPVDVANEEASTCASRDIDAGAPPSPPAALVTAMTNAAPGDVVSLSGLNTANVPSLAVTVCPAPDAPALLFSDSPEMPSADGILYADTVNAGRYRLYVYQANGGNALRKFPIVVFNPGATTAHVKIVRRGLAAASKQYVSVGKTVLLDWLADETLPDVVVPAGARVLLDPALDAIAAGKDELVHAIFDVVTDAQLKISFVSVAANADAVTATAGFSVLPRDVDHQRGTFPGADVVISAMPSAQKPGVQKLHLGKDEIDATMKGVDRTDGTAMTLAGNFGMVYRIDLGLSATARAGISARGGDWGGVAHDGTASIALPSSAQTLPAGPNAVVVGSIGPMTKLRLATAGGSNLPIDLFLLTP